MQGPYSRIPRPDLSGWLTAGAIFWFEAFGIMGLALIGVMPLAGFMHATFPPPSWTDGSVLRLAAALVIVAVFSAAAGVIAGRYPRARAVAFLGLGLAGFVAIAASVPADSLPLALLWLGWPSVTLVKVWSSRLRSTSSSPPST